MPSKANIDMLKKAEESLDNSQGVFVIDYRGITVKESQQLRRSLTEAGATMKIYKNNIVKIALKDHDLPELDDILVGPCAYVFYEKDPVEAAKAIKQTSTELKKIEFLGGISDGQAITAEQALAIADLPGRDQLIGMLANVLASPLTGIARVLNGPVQGLATVLTRISEQEGGDSGEGEAA